MNDADHQAPKKRWTENEIKEAFRELAKPDRTQNPADDIAELVRRTREEAERQSFGDKEASRSSDTGRGRKA